MNRKKQLQNTKASSVKLMWVLATQPFPVTTREIADLLGLDPTSKSDRQAVSTQMRRLHESGLVTRRRVRGKGGPYEYAINPAWDPEAQE